MIDRGDANLRSMRQDFHEGRRNVSQGIAAHDAHWGTQAGRRGDQAYYQDLIELRNALAHGNQRQLDELRARGVFDRVTWARTRLPGLDRIARALDRVIWDHLHNTFGRNPW